MVIDFADCAGDYVGQTLQSTLASNPAIQQAKLKLEAAAGRRLVFRSVIWPSVRMNVPGGVQGGDRAGSTSTKLFGFVRGALNQPLLDMAIPPSLRRGDIEILIAQQQLNLAVEDQLHARAGCVLFRTLSARPEVAPRETAAPTERKRRQPK